MSGILKSLTHRVIKVRVHQAINHKMTQKIASDLHKARFFKPEAVFVSISSMGGSLTQAKNIQQLLQSYCAKNNVAMYCFAEDQCLGAANVLLTSGVKSYANPMSIIGDFGFVWGSLWLQKFGEKYNVKPEFITSGSHKMRMNPFEQLTPENEKWMKNIYYQLDHELKVSVINNRQIQFRNVNMDKEALNKQIFNQGLITPEKAKELGLIDGIADADDILNSKYSGTKVHEINNPRGRGQLFQQFYKRFETSIINV